MNRRDFARLLAIGGAALCHTGSGVGSRRCAGKLPPTPASPDEKFWTAVRQFVMPKDLTMLNAANLCPSSAPVLETMAKMTKDMDQDPSSDNRAKLGDGRENTRKMLADFLRVTPRKWSSPATPASRTIWCRMASISKPATKYCLPPTTIRAITPPAGKAKRFGFKVIDVPTPNPHRLRTLCRCIFQGDHAADQSDRVHASHVDGR